MSLAIVAIEALVMLLLHFFIEPLHLSAVAEAFIDSFALLIFLFPILYSLFYRPLVLEIIRHKQTVALNQAILQTIPFGMDIVDEEGNIMYLGPKLEAKFGKEAIGRKCWELYRDNHRQCLNCPLISEVVLGKTATIETSDVLGGRIFQISHTGMLYQGKEAILEIFQDITQRKRAEEMLAMLSAAVKQTADIVVITDKEGVIEYVNPAFEALTGYTKEEAIGKTPRILKSGKHDAAFYQRLWAMILAGKVFKGVLVNKKKNGELYYTEKTITPIKDASGNITRFVSTDKDITESKRYEQELIQANRELLQLDRLKSDFLDSVSHELRTPLAMIKEGVSQVDEGLHGRLQEEQRHFLDKAMENINRLTRVVNSIIDVANLEAGKIELKKQAVDIIDVAGRIISIFSPQAKSKGLEITTSFPEHKVELRTDKDRLAQVFTNLIENAVKFTERGEIEVKIIEKDNVVECSVSDTGKGIPQENLTKVFDKFQQFDRLSGPGAKGTGVGLAITKGIVELQQGKIWAESEPGKGSRFSFWLPKA